MNANSKWIRHIAARWLEGIIIIPEPEILDAVIETANRMRFAQFGQEI